jgi:uncharacterized protein YcfJ
MPRQEELPVKNRIALWASSLALCLGAAAPGHAAPPPAGENVTYAYAQVLRVTPVHGMAAVRVPEKRCEVRNDGRPSKGCRTVQVERNARGIVGYDVEYQYKGEAFMSRLRRDPGSRLRIRVTITPVQGAERVH